MTNPGWTDIRARDVGGHRAAAARETTPEPDSRRRSAGPALPPGPIRRKPSAAGQPPTLPARAWALPGNVGEPGPVSWAPAVAEAHGPAPGMVGAITADLLNCVGLTETLGPLASLQFDLELRGMGALQARILQGAGGMEIHLAAAEPATSRELERYLPDLEARLTDAGVPLRQLSVSRSGDASSAREESAAGGGETRDDSADDGYSRCVGFTRPEWRRPAP